MRIIIEIDERGGTSAQLSEQPQGGEAADAGPPPASLLQAIGMEAGGSSAQPGGADAADAGGPPQWLHEAIAGAGPAAGAVSGEAASGEATDAGSAPGDEG